MSSSLEVGCQPNQCCIRNFCPHRLSPFEIRTITIEYEKGDTIFTHGDPVTGLYVLCNGKVWIEKRTRSGKKQILDIVGPGSIFGRSSLRGRRKYFACARTLTESMVLYINKRDLPKLAEDPDTALKIMRILSKKIHDLQQRLIITSFGNVRTRLAKLLLSLAREFGRECENGIIINLKLTKTDLSQIAGVTRESATTQLLWMEKRGLIFSSKNEIVLSNKKALEKL